MGYARLALYLVGLLIVVWAAWIFLTQTPVGDQVPPGVALALILLLVGIGVMAGARALDGTFTTRRRVTHDADGRMAPVAPAQTTTYHDPTLGRTTTYQGAVPPAGGTTETVVEERRY